jgi:hypothetical protein
MYKNEEIRKSICGAGKERIPTIPWNCEGFPDFLCFLF